MTNPWNDLAAYYDLDILVFYLMNEENSPFYKAIIKSGLALKFSQKDFIQNHITHLFLLDSKELVNLMLIKSFKRLMRLF